jgi:hypothetical protein
MTEHDPRYDFSNQAPVYWTAAHAINMTLRDYFAAQSLRGFIQEDFHTPTYKQIAEACYKLADAMLEARKHAP